jgi:hypothetical protein
MSRPALAHSRVGELAPGRRNADGLEPQGRGACGTGKNWRGATLAAPRGIDGCFRSVAARPSAYQHREDTPGGEQLVQCRPSPAGRNPPGAATGSDKPLHTAPRERSCRSACDGGDFRKLLNVRAALGVPVFRQLPTGAECLLAGRLMLPKPGPARPPALLNVESNRMQSGEGCEAGSRPGKEEPGRDPEQPGPRNGVDRSDPAQTRGTRQPRLMTPRVGTAHPRMRSRTSGEGERPGRNLRSRLLVSGDVKRARLARA